MEDEEQEQFLFNDHEYDDQIEDESVDDQEQSPDSSDDFFDNNDLPDIYGDLNVGTFFNNNITNINSLPQDEIHDAPNIELSSTGFSRRKQHPALCTNK